MTCRSYARPSQWVSRRATAASGEHSSAATVAPDSHMKGVLFLTTPTVPSLSSCHFSVFRERSWSVAVLFVETNSSIRFSQHLHPKLYDTTRRFAISYTPTPQNTPSIPTLYPPRRLIDAKDRRPISCLLKNLILTLPLIHIAPLCYFLELSRHLVVPFLAL
ncbi:uncharacterized protein J3D65DRAFT_95137 [Phyllosticta citribraziliensis]|uniref:Uncharacterized protein n=1 Tax=Phyllosticta citribraziliensis TaxID=989973 RepID=A0ABR1LBW8_9PEZI